MVAIKLGRRDKDNPFVRHYEANVGPVGHISDDTPEAAHAREMIHQTVAEIMDDDSIDPDDKRVMVQTLLALLGGQKEG